MYYIYIIACGDDSLYTGITTDPARRLREHAGRRGAKYTAARGVKRLCALWLAADRSAALRLEYRLKQLSRREKEQLIESGYCRLDLSQYSRLDPADFIPNGGQNDTP